MGDLPGWHKRLTETGPQGAAERLLVALLIPCGWGYGLLMWGRAALYRQGLFRIYRAPVPVVAVGNLAVGGTGKTPVVDYVVKELLARGRRVAIVSRGYGGSGLPGVGLVSAGDGTGPLLPASTCGDEPYLLARRNPAAVVLVAPRRAAGIARAVAAHGAEVIVLDDAFQHLAVARDLDLVLLDARRPLSNGRVLPAGRLREFPAALDRADLLLLTRSEGGEVPALPVTKPLCHCCHALDPLARSLSGEARPLADLAGRAVFAFAGIAEPESFFSALRGAGLTLAGSLPLPDHVVYDETTLARLRAAAAGAEILVTTEKDGVKLRADDLPLSCYEVPVTVAFAEAAPLAARLERLLKKEPQ